MAKNVVDYVGIANLIFEKNPVLMDCSYCIWSENYGNKQVFKQPYSVELYK